MSFSDEQLDGIYHSTSGHCVHCQKKLARKNYGLHGARAAWTVDHSRAQARGGSHHANNLRPACIKCNSTKRDTPARAYRATLGHSGTPLSRKQVAAKREDNRWAGRILGGALGLLTGNPLAVVLAAAGGDAIGKAAKVSPRRKTERSTPRRK